MAQVTFCMTEVELQRYHLLRKALDGELTLTEVALALGVSYRHAKRLKAQVAAAGASGMAHGNRGRPPGNKLPAAEQARLRQLCVERYSAFNDTHCCELLASREGITVSREVVRQLRRAAGMPAKRRRRVRRRHHKRRERMPAAGMMILWDGSLHRWFGPSHPPCCLMLAIDDATGEVVGAHFCRAETSADYLRLLRQVVEGYGIPGSVYQDRHGALKRNDDHWSLQEQLDGRQEPTQVGAALEALGITPLFARSPQAKGRVERVFGTLQDRLVAEMELAGVSDMEGGNAFLGEFLSRFNTQFSASAAESTPSWRRVSRGLDLERVLSFRYEAVVGNDNAIRLGGHVLDLPPGARGQGYARQRVEARQLLDGRWRVYLDNKLLLEAPATEVVEPLRRRKANPRAPGAHDAEWIYTPPPARPAAGRSAKQRGRGIKGTRIA